MYDVFFGRVSEAMFSGGLQTYDLPINSNPETLAIFRKTVNPKDLTYKHRLGKWMIESPAVEL